LRPKPTRAHQWLTLSLIKIQMHRAKVGGGRAMPKSFLGHKRRLSFLHDRGRF
jgi:hypothetical protein